jgi:polyhydroxyalkanoate synthesis regulator protein
MPKRPKASRRTPIIIKFQRCYHAKIGVLLDANLDLYGLDELRRWAARKINFVVIDSDTGEDITRILLA